MEASATTACEKDLAQSREEASRVKKDVTRLEKENRELLERSKNSATVEQRLASLDSENQKLQKELQQATRALESRTQRATGTGDQYVMVWLLVAGAGIWLVGLILGKMSRKKEYY